jgi:hypothetical protein
MAATSTEPQTAVTLKTVIAVGGGGGGAGAEPPAPAAKTDHFSPLRALVEQLLKDAREEGRVVGLKEGRTQGLQRAMTVIGIAMSQLSVDDRNKLAKVVESIEVELTK